MTASSLIACHACDLLHRRKDLAHRSAARCARCGSVLYRCHAGSLERALAYSLAAAVLFVLANLYPFLFFKMQGRVEVNTMFTGVVRLAEWGQWPLASVVLLASIVVPGLKVLGHLYLLTPLAFGRVPWKGARVFRFLRAAGPWGMLEVYMLGTLIAIANLQDMASIALGLAFYSFIGLMLMTTAASAVLDPEVVWRRLDRR